MWWVFILCLEKQKTKAKPWSDRATHRISFLGLSNEFAQYSSNLKAKVSGSHTSENADGTGKDSSVGRCVIQPSDVKTSSDAVAPYPSSHTPLQVTFHL